ncbi:hypothetical protein C8R47DRAFT_1120741 [Mycena vitilis]|nr:hypothetical protein C8R47DRAFT_1120741 [Mycena vitilis]
MRVRLELVAPVAALLGAISRSLGSIRDYAAAADSYTSHATSGSTRASIIAPYTSTVGFSVLSLCHWHSPLSSLERWFHPGAERVARKVPDSYPIHARQGLDGGTGGRLNLPWRQRGSLWRRGIDIHDPWPEMIG